MSYIDQITVGSTTYDIQDSNAQRKMLEGAGAPTTSTVGTIGQHYYNTSATQPPYEYICTAISNGTYTWLPFGMTILKYGSSTWAEFIAAYNAHEIVYCRASSNSNPATGAQTRLAFMAYVNADPPTSVEFQYYRSVSTHSDSQQGDQVYIYKLTNAGTWSVTVRETYTKIVASTGLNGTWSNGALTITNTQTPLPAVSSSDDGKVLAVASGAWATSSIYQIPSGGTQGQILKKLSAADYDVVWSSETSEVMCVTVTEASNVYSSNKTIDEILTAINNGYNVYVIYYGTVFSLTDYSTTNAKFRYNYISSTSSYEQIITISKDNNSTKVTRTYNTLLVPTIYNQLCYKVYKENNIYYLDKTSDIDNIAVLNLLEYQNFGSVYLYYGDAGEELPHTEVYENNIDFYTLEKFWRTEALFDDGYDELWTVCNHAIFSKIAYENGTVKYKAFTILEHDGYADGTVTYSETNLGLAPSAQGVNF